jgi:hypothetical protein
MPCFLPAASPLELTNTSHLRFQRKRQAPPYHTGQDPMHQQFIQSQTKGASAFVVFIVIASEPVVAPMLIRSFVSNMYRAFTFSNGFGEEEETGVKSLSGISLISFFSHAGQIWLRCRYR